MNAIDPDSKWAYRWERRCSVLYQVKVTYRYHRKRQRHFDLIDKGTKAVTVLLGASLFGEHLRPYVPLTATAISGLGLMALVYGYGDRKQSHKELAEAAMQLVAKIEETPNAKIVEETPGIWEAEHARLNAKEPPALSTLVVLCEREESTANGHPDHVPLPSWHKRIVANWLA